jgi:hypothetical protein
MIPRLLDLKSWAQPDPVETQSEPSFAGGAGRAVSGSFAVAALDARVRGGGAAPGCGRNPVRR